LWWGLIAVSSFAQGYGSSTPDTSGLAKRTGAINALLSVQALAEDVIDFALIKDWQRVATDVSVLENAWAKYDTLKSQEPLYAVMQMALSGSMSQLKSASADKNSTASIQAANNLSSAVSNLIENQRPPVPADIYLLEILERQLAVDGTAGNFKGADRCLDKMKMVWNRTKGSVQDRRGFELAGKYSASLRSQEIAAMVEDGPALAKEADKGSQLLQNIKNLFD
jgi:hypothetical protein